MNISVYASSRVVTPILYRCGNTTQLFQANHPVNIVAKRLFTARNMERMDATEWKALIGLGGGAGLLGYIRGFGKDFPPETSLPYDIFMIYCACGFIGGPVGLMSGITYTFGLGAASIHKRKSTPDN